MLSKILMPSGGQTTDEMVILKWYKAVGDDIKQGDILFEIETDKAILIVESYAVGTVLEIKYPEGAMVKTGEIVAYIGKPGTILPSSNQTGSTELPQLTKLGIELEVEVKMITIEPEISPITFKATVTNVKDKRVLASPLAKQRARTGNVSLEQIAAHFSKNQIRKKDVENYITALGEAHKEGAYFIDVNSVRRTIAKRTQESVQTAPHYFVSMDVDMGDFIVLRNSLNETYKGQGVRISYHDIIMKVVSKVIESYPMINSSYQGEKIKVFKEVNFGLAVAVEGGLVVPVVNHTNIKSIAEIATINSRNIEKARNSKLEEHDISRGTITLSNLGMFGVNSFTAVINQPESCILAVSSIITKAVVINGEIVIRKIMNITGSFDHRVIDGAVGAAFLEQVKRMIENPQLLSL